MSIKTNQEVNNTQKHITKTLLIACFGLAHSVEAIYASSMPNIAAAMGISSNSVQLLSMSGFLGFSFGILMFGRFSDIWGRRPIMIIGFSLYFIFTLLTFFTTNLDGLLICRFVQSFGVSVGSAVAQAIMRDVFRGRALSGMYSVVTGGLAFIPSLAAGFGGFIAARFGWEYNMALLCIAGISVLVFSILSLQETHNHREEVKSVSYLKIVKRILKDRKIWMYAIAIGSSNGILFGFFIETPFIVMKKCLLEPYYYAIVMIVITLGLFISSIISSFLVKIIEPYVLIKYGGNISVVSSIMIILVGILDSYVNKSTFIILLVVSRVVFVISHSLIIPNCLRFSLENYSGVNGTAGAIFGFIYYIFVAISNGLVAIFHSDVSIIPAGLQFLVLSIATFVVSRAVNRTEPKLSH